MAPRKKAKTATWHKRQPRTPRVAWAKWYALFAVAVLGVSSTIWALLGAKVQQGNADQLVNVYLFQSWHTFHSALFPSAHSFLIKWPLFWLAQLFGPTPLTFTLGTVVLSLATVGGFAYVLYRIDRRPLVYGTLFLALASVLVLVPPEPYAGALLPVNMAMITTRNIEYLIFIASLWTFLRTPKLRTSGPWIAMGVLGLLIASDKLFLTLAVGSAVAAAGIYSLARRTSQVRLAIGWGGVSIGATVLGIGLLWAINKSGFTHIAGLSSSPYHIVHSLKDLTRGTFYACFGLLTNFGANPAFDASVPGAVLHNAKDRLLAPAGLAYVANGIIVVGGIYMTMRLFLASFKAPAKKAKPDIAARLSELLIWASIVALGAFIVTDHYYVVDARYLTIILFAVFTASATYLRGCKIMLKPQHILYIGLALAGSTALGFFSAVTTYHANLSAQSDHAQRTALISTSLQTHPVNIVVGDYWRTLPVKAAVPATQQVMPLSDCMQPRDILSSKAWQPDLQTHSFAYILSLEPSVTGFPACTLNQIIAAYGRPNQSVLTAGSLNDPKEFLLYYDHGINKSAPVTGPSPVTSTVLPVSVDQLPNTNCPDASTIMNVVAHQDDDLLFLNPDLLRDIRAGHCVRTVYMTSGDAGEGQLYWQKREQGAEAAYASLLGQDVIWVQRVAKLATGQFVTIANPRGNQRISLIFMRLPDGNISGKGFKASHFESLARLHDGHIPIIHSGDRQSAYTYSQLAAALATLMKTYSPLTIHTQATYNASSVFPDHSDHMEVGRVTHAAFQQYNDHSQATIAYYIGYPIRQMPPNVSGDELAKKTAAFLAYGKFDGAVCQNIEQCSRTPTYGSYLKRQYTGHQ
ncbi:MAG TPA: PIG-L family deacetylase [Candidatus Saccharimonadales bacterium]|nr:PIG-L family deacetylase [Candidatus Saccharimonadales bacterium]